MPLAWTSPADPLLPPGVSWGRTLRRQPGDPAHLTTSARMRMLSFSLRLYRSFSSETPLAVMKEARLALPAAWIRASTATSCSSSCSEAHSAITLSITPLSSRARLPASQGPCRRQDTVWMARSFPASPWSSNQLLQAQGRLSHQGRHRGPSFPPTGHACTHVGRNRGEAAKAISWTAEPIHRTLPDNIPPFTHTTRLSPLS